MPMSSYPTEIHIPSNKTTGNRNNLFTTSKPGGQGENSVQTMDTTPTPYDYDENDLNLVLSPEFNTENDGLSGKIVMPLSPNRKQSNRIWNHWLWMIGLK